MFWYEKILNKQSAIERISSEYAILKWLEDYSQRKVYNLVSFNKAIGSLTWENNYDSFAYGDICGNKYYLDKKGLLKPHLLIRDVKKPELVSELYYNKKTHSGELKLIEGQIIKWRRKNSWKNEWEFFNTASEDKNYSMIASFTSITSFVKSGCIVKIHELDFNNEILSKMILLGMYFISTTVDDNMTNLSLY